MTRVVHGAVLGLLCACLTQPASAQTAEGAVSRGRPPNDIPVDGLGRVVVRVRAITGAPLPAQALVRLSSPTNAFDLTLPIRENSQAEFVGVPPGEYRVEVSAPGFELFTDEAGLWSQGGTMHIFAELRPASPGGEPARPAAGAILAPKAQKELQKATAALEADDLAGAQQHLERAYKMAPAHPDVNYLLGVLCTKRNDRAQAKTYLQKVISLNPQHSSALAMLATLLQQEGKYAEAIPLLEQALRLKPEAWEVNWSLATALLRERQWEKAKSHAERALELGGAPAAPVHLLLARILAELQQRGHALKQIDKFLKYYTSHAATGVARQMREELGLSPAEAPAPKPAPPPAPPVPRPELPLARWAPPSVDESKPTVSTEVACSLSGVLQATGRRLHDLVRNLEHFSATEHIQRTTLDVSGNPRSVQEESWNYVVDIREVRSNTLSVDEYRQRVGNQAAPGKVITTGLAAFAVIFHPYYIKDFDMRCEGLAYWQGQPVWSIYFQQRAEKPSRVRIYSTREGRFPIRLKGRAWIAANSFYIVRIETDLLEPVPAIRLEKEHLVIEYRPVKFQKRNVQLWLPATADYYALFRGDRLHLRHSFSDYLLFSVDLNRRIPEAKPPEDPPGEGTPPPEGRSQPSQ